MILDHIYENLATRKYSILRYPSDPIYLRFLISCTLERVQHFFTSFNKAYIVNLYEIKLLTCGTDKVTSERHKNVIKMTSKSTMADVKAEYFQAKIDLI